MCLGIPGRVTALTDDRGVPMGTVDFGGVTRQVCLVYTPDVERGAYVIVHAGFAIAVLDEEAAADSLRLFEELGLEG